jgi:hypothetical protein
MPTSSGLDRHQQLADLDGQTVRQRVQADVDSALASGARGTPTLFINGRLHVAGYDEATLVVRPRGVLPPPGHRSHALGPYGDEQLAFAVALAFGTRTIGQQLDLGAPDPVRITAGIARPEQPLLPLTGFL